MFLGAAFILALISFAAATPSETDAAFVYSDFDGSRDDSSPAAATVGSRYYRHDNRRRLATIPNDETRRSHAPLRPDDGRRRVDARRARACPAGYCWSGARQSCHHATPSECANNNNGAGINNGSGSTNWQTNGVVQNVNGNGTCQASQCFVHHLQLCLHITSHECQNPRPSRRPTFRPLPAPIPPPVEPVFPIVSTFHPLQILLRNLPSRFTWTAEARALIIRYVKETIERNLNKDFELVEVAFGGHLIHDDRGDDAASLPLRVTVRGPSNLSDLALSYVLEAIPNDLRDLVNQLKDMDQGTFKDVGLDVGTYNFSDTVDETNQPTNRPTSRPPSRRPTPRPTPRPTRRPSRQPSRRPTRRPRTPRPTRRPVVRYVTTIHPIALTLGNLPPDYRLTAEARDFVIQSVREWLEDRLENDMEVVDVVAEDGYLISDAEDVSVIPLRVTLRGPEDASDFARSLLLDVLYEFGKELANRFQSLGWECFEDVDVTTDAYDLDDVAEETDQPTRGPSERPSRTPTRRPSRWPTRRPTPEPTSEPSPGPSPRQMVQSVNIVGLKFKDVYSSYSLSSAHVASIIGFVKDALRNDLDPFELVDIVHVGDGDSLSPLPLGITVKGPADSSVDALDRILGALRDDMKYIVNKIKSLDRNAFKDVVVSVGSNEETSDNAAGPAPGGGDVAASDTGSQQGPDAGEGGASSATGPQQGPGAGEGAVSSATGPQQGSGAAGPVSGLEEEEGAVEEKETVHLVQLILGRVPDGHRFTPGDRASILRFVKELMEEDLDDSLELIRVAFEGDGANNGRTVPLRVTVKGPADQSDFALAYVMDSLEDRREDIEMFVKSLNWNELKNVGVSVETYDPNAVTSEPAAEAVEMESTEHPVMLTLKNTLSGSILTPGDRASIIRFIKELLEDNMDDSLELIEVAYAGSGSDSVSLPLRITVKGPSNQSDFALAYVMEVIKNHEGDIEMFVKSLDWNEFKNVSVSAETYDPTTVIAQPAAEAVKMKKTEHPVQLTFGNVPSGYRLAPADRASIIRFVKELLDDNLDESLELIGVEYPGNNHERRLLSSTPRHIRRLDAVSLPLHVTVKGPADQSDFALSYIMEVIEDHKQDLLRKLKSLDWDAFKNVGLSAGTYDSAAVVEPMPEIREMETMAYTVQLILDNVPSGYRLSEKDRASILRFVKELMEDDIDDQFQLIKVAYAGREKNVNVDGTMRGDDGPSLGSINPSSLASSHKNKNGRNLLSSRRPDAISLPLEITVEGQADLADFALSYVMEVIDDNMQDLVRKLKSLDWDAFKDVKVSTASYDPYLINEPSSETAAMEETEHPVQLAFDEIVAGYRLSAGNRALIIRFVTELLKENLDHSLDLVKVAYAGRRRNQSLLPHTRRLEVLYLPIVITVRGPTDESDVASSYVREVLDDHEQDIELYLRSIDDEAFMSPVSIDDISDPAGIGSNAVQIMGGREEDAPWWVTSWWIWLVVAIGILFLLCCLCICCGCLMRIKSKHRRTDDEVSDNKAIVVEKPVFVEKPLIIEKPVFYPPMQHSNMLVPYQPNQNNMMVPYHPRQANENTMIPYQPRINPATVQNGTRLLPYAPHQADAYESRRREIMPPYEEDSSEDSSWEIDTGMSSYTSRRLEPPPREEASVRQTPLRICEAPAERPRRTLAATPESVSARSARRTAMDPPERKESLALFSDVKSYATPSAEQEPLQLCADPTKKKPLQICQDPNNQEELHFFEDSDEDNEDYWDEDSYSTQPPHSDFIEDIESEIMGLWDEDDEPRGFSTRIV